MVARLQGFPDDWEFRGKKTSEYRQIGNAFPPKVAEALGRSLVAALDRERPEIDLKLEELFSRELVAGA